MKLALGNPLLIVSLLALVGAGAMVGTEDGRAVAQDGAGPPAVAAPTLGYRVRIPLPLTGSSDAIVKQTVQRIVDQIHVGGERPLMVFEFWSAPGSEGAGSEFERALSLARFLASPKVERVRTVAFIPRAVTGHAVLPVMACEQIIMDADAVLGDAGLNERTIGPAMRGSYAEIARSRRTIPEAIALGMLDAELRIDRVTTANGELYTWPEELERIKQQRNDIQSIDEVIPAGRLGRFRGDELRQMGFVSYLAKDHEELAKLLNVPADQLEFDPSAGGQWRAIRVELNGPVTAQAVERIIRTVQQQRDQQQINFILLQLDSPGGSPLESLKLSNFLADLDTSQVRTIAYVTREARADAMLIAFACDHLVANPRAVLGGGGAVDINDQTAADLRPALEQIAARKSRNWSLVDAMLNPTTAVYRYSQTGTNQVRYLCEDEYQQKLATRAVEPEGEAIAGDWVRGDLVTAPERVLQVDGREGESLGLVRYLAEDLRDVLQFYQLPDTPALIGPNWAFDLIDALASPRLAAILLFVGGVALISELSSPGIGIGGFLAALCYLLYFWSNFLHGTAEVLEILLFLVGIACILIEVFVIPGFGIFGLGGGGLIMVSLILASQTFILPSNDYQLGEFSRSMMTLIAAGIGIFASLLLLRKHLHRAPFLGRIMLLPPTGNELQLRGQRESLVDYEHLLGQAGVTRTQLTPSGKAVIGGEVIDVISEGELIPRGSRVQVVEAIGNHVVVRALPTAP